MKRYESYKILQKIMTYRPTNLPTDGHQGSKGSYTSNNVPIKGVGNKISGERIYKITKEIFSEQFYCSVVLDPSPPG